MNAAGGPVRGFEEGFQRGFCSRGNFGWRSSSWLGIRLGLRFRLGGWSLVSGWLMGEDLRRGIGGSGLFRFGRLDWGSDLDWFCRGLGGFRFHLSNWRSYGWGDGFF